MTGVFESENGGRAVKETDREKGNEGRSFRDSRFDFRVSSDSSDFIEEYKKRLKKAVAAERSNREAAVLSLRMSDGDQWDDKEKSRRTQRGRPVLTGNLLEASIMQAVGDARHNHARVKVRSVSAGGDQKLADIRAGIIREVEYVSNAEAIYDYAHEMQCRGAYGAWRVLTRYCKDNPFIQEIYLERIKNPLTVLMDPDARDAQYADAKFGFILEKMSEKEFKEKYPGKAVSSDPTTATAGMTRERAYDKGSVTVAEYYVVEEEKKTFCLMSDGRVMEKEEADRTVEEAKAQWEAQQARLLEQAGLEGGMSSGFEGGHTSFRGTSPQLEAPPLSITEEKESDVPKVYRYVMSDSEILEGKQAIPGEFIPIVVAKGKEYNVEGETRVRSLIANAIDPQKYYNYWITATAEVISLAPKNPYIGTAKQFKGYEKDYAVANVENMPFLKYNVDPDAPVTKPTREPTAPVPAALLAEVQQAEGMVRKAIGMGNRDLGEIGPERSGIAIRQIQKPGDIGTFVFVDNLNRAIQHSGRIVNSMIPEVYDTRRDIRMHKEDGTGQFVPINIPAGDLVEHTKANLGVYGLASTTAQTQETGRLNRFVKANGHGALYNSMSSGHFEVMIDTGPNYATQRQEAGESLLKLAAIDRRLFMIGPDLVYANQDFEGASELAKRYRKTLPAGMVEPEPGEEPSKPLPPAPQAQVMMLKTQNEAKKLEIKQTELQVKAAHLQVEKLKALKEAQGGKEELREMVIGVVKELLG
jgi:hypothetical protein